MGPFQGSVERAEGLVHVKPEKWEKFQGQSKRPGGWEPRSTPTAGLCKSGRWDLERQSCRAWERATGMLTWWAAFLCFSSPQQKNLRCLHMNLPTKQEQTYTHREQTWGCQGGGGRGVGDGRIGSWGLAHANCYIYNG